MYRMQSNFISQAQNGETVSSPYIGVPIEARYRLKSISSNMDSIRVSSSISSDDVKSRRNTVVMVPLPAQSHLNQLLHLARSLATRGLSVMFVATSSHIHQVRHRVEGWNPDELGIRFQELPLTDFPDLQPDIRSTHKFPTHLMPLLEAYENLREPLDRLIEEICSSNGKTVGSAASAGRIAMVYDPLLGWVQTVAAKYGVPAYIFRCLGAYPSLSLIQSFEKGHRNFPGVPSTPLKRCAPETFIEFASRQKPLQLPAKGIICNTFFELESKFINLWREETGKPIWTVGPLLPQPFLNPGDEQVELLGNPDDWECLRWLDTQAPASVVYVSFGTVSSLSPQQIRELALGLESSRQPFLWVLRVADSAIFSTDPKTGWISDCLPEGYEDRMNGRGLIARNWAPQLHVLSHKSIGGFISHCGWNSVIESISMGVPMVVWPLHSDQPANGVLVARELKVGLEMKAWSHEEEDELVKAEEIERAVRRLMVDEEGAEIRKRAIELRNAARRANAEGGSSWCELESFVNHLETTLEPTKENTVDDNQTYRKAEI